MSTNTIYVAIEKMSDKLVQHLYRRIKSEDLLLLMYHDSIVKDIFFRNVKMTTRLWLQSEIDKMNTPDPKDLARVEELIASTLAELTSNPPEEFD